MGHQVEVIDYRPRYIEDAYKLSITSRLQTDSLGSFLKSVLREFMLLPTRFCRRKGFDSFIHNYLSLSREVIGTQIPNEYDVYVVGSDQIWNRAITDGYDNVFFCDFQFEKKGRKYISYAASTEQASMAESDISVFEDRLSVFDAVSVREDAFVDYLSRSSKHNIYKVIDPTLLHGKLFWDQLLSPSDSQKDYIVLYQARYNRELVHKAREIADRMHCQLIEMSAWTLPISRITKKGMKASPLEFINYIKNAKLVLSTSFHGTAFSVIFEVPFYYVSLSDGWDIRAISLLQDINLVDRMVTLETLQTTKIIASCDFSRTNELIEVLRQKSIAFLKEYIY